LRCDGTVLTGNRKRGGRGHHGAGRDPHVGSATERHHAQAAGRDQQAAPGRRVVTRCEKPGAGDHWSHDRGDQAAIKIGQGDTCRRQREKCDSARGRRVEAAQQRQQIERYPLGLGDVYVIAGFAR
jgi:hypothetical protein